MWVAETEDRCNLNAKVRTRPTTSCSSQTNDRDPFVDMKLPWDSSFAISARFSRQIHDDRALLHNTNHLLAQKSVNSSPSRLKIRTRLSGNQFGRRFSGNESLKGGYEIHGKKETQGENSL